MQKNMFDEFLICYHVGWHKKFLEFVIYVHVVWHKKVLQNLQRCCIGCKKLVEGLPLVHLIGAMPSPHQTVLL
jgi:hypothetical protein